jgi:hypothetical protein
MFNSQSGTRRWACGLVLALTALIVPAAQAAPIGTPTEPGTTVFPDLRADDPGELLASMVSPFSFVVPPPSGGTTSGEIRSAVYRNTTGTLDFYYQVVNNDGSATALARESNANFAGFDVATAFRLDGGALGTIFTDGTVIPFTADRGVQGIVVGFNFGPLPEDQIQPGMTTAILVVSTNAVTFTTGTASVIDGGTATVTSFQPAAIPEPSSALLVFGGIALALGRLRNRRK